MLAAFLIFIREWSLGIELSLSGSVSTLAMVFYLFVTINQLTYIAVFQLFNFLAILERIGSVLRLEDFKKEGDIKDQVNPQAIGFESQTQLLEDGRAKPLKDISESHIRLKDASFNWGFRLLDKT